MWKIKLLFGPNKLLLEKKGHEKACVCIHAYAHTCSRSVCTCFMHAVDAQARLGAENCRRHAFIRPTAVATALAHTGPCWRAFLECMVLWVFTQSFGCSLSLSLLVEEGRSTFGFMARIWAKF